MSDTSSVSGTSSANIDSEIDKMTSAFNTAIETNEKITVVKTEKGAEETAAQQRPNIG
ncbi:hypothetical protein ACLEIY_15040 [Acetobacter tropicalis]|uniref:Uncharacterized protein n=2 Tax=Acetobacter TaxID=434 RepID=A0A177G6W3_9PROT|nr:MULTISPECIES: hypothetical protein [Acetobacter]OAG75541.1 hypothetical protein Amal_03270 [Acetobacter malorum]GAL98916.1 hypothetical protein ATR1_441c0016 [Acetobacter tropicalis]GBR68874.1 hypothetical protein AA0312_1122 [Acetobacter tropicalis NRIC 0312]GEL51542.1 hypothetical protein ATR01nite_26170 [Acetobacter tropicalis]